MCVHVYFHSICICKYNIVYMWRSELNTSFNYVSEYQSQKLIYYKTWQQVPLPSELIFYSFCSISGVIIPFEDSNVSILEQTIEKNVKFNFEFLGGPFILFLRIFISMFWTLLIYSSSIFDFNILSTAWSRFFLY